MEHASPKIDWNKLISAKDYFVRLGYEEIAVPWVVSRQTCLETFANTTDRFDIYLGTLVGSAEQSFLELARSDLLTVGKEYCAITPCFRWDNFDSLHFPYFMKLELFRLGSANYADDFGSDALKFYTYAFGADVEKQETDIGFDLLVNGIEVGSYGHRTSGNLSWTYGTGIAEPRFTTAYMHGLN